MSPRPRLTASDSVNIVFCGHNKALEETRDVAISREEGNIDGVEIRPTSIISHKHYKGY
jgi:hypothetical protein